MARKKKTPKPLPKPTDPFVVQLAELVEKNFPGLQRNWYTWTDKYSIQGGQPFELLGQLLRSKEHNDYLDKISYRVEFYKAYQAAKFLKIAEKAGLKARPYHKIKKSGLNWVRTKTFTTVIVYKEPASDQASHRDAQGPEDAEGQGDRAG